MTAYRKTVWFIKGLSEYTVNGFLEAQKKFECLDALQDLNGKAFMVTGANSGIGKCVAFELAKRGATVHMVCRDKARGEAAKQEILQAASPDNNEIYLHLLDMSIPQKVWEFGLRFAASGKPLNCLVNNAGCMVNERTLTDDGLEKNFATNTLGTFILTNSLISALEKNESPRVITVSSGGMLLMKLDVENLQFENMSPFDGAMAYAQNKRQQVVMTERWAEMYKTTGIHFSSMHPGWADTPAVQLSMPDFHRKMKNKLRTPEQGADTVLWLCISPEAVKEPSGSFFQDRTVVNKHLPLAWTKSSSTQDETLISKLSELAEKFRPQNIDE